MWLYSALSKIFPRSYMAKVFTVAFIGTHVPLIALLGWAIWNGTFSGEGLVVLLVGLVATLGGTAATLLALHAVLKPIYQVESTVSNFEIHGAVKPLPFGYDDQVGRLMSSVNRLILSVDDRIDASRRAAETDPLTGILNRRGFEARVWDGMQGAMLVIDVDRFKAVNDLFGHSVGDTVLRDLAVILKTTVRRRDVLARIGGEEFVVFLPGVSIGEAREAAERLRASIAGQLRAETDPVTVSIGLAMTRPGLDRSGLFAEADRGLYAAKQGGRNRVCVAVVAQGGLATA